MEAFAYAGHLVWGCSRSYGVDVTDADAVERYAALRGPIDLWVNNAGVLGPLGPVTEVDFRRNLEVNVLGVVHGTQAFLRHKAPDGVLVNISSGAATTPYEHWGPYCASKAAVDMLTEVTALEGHARAYAVSPGLIDTDMQAELRRTDFPGRDRFVRAKEAEAFNSPAWVARHLLEVAFGDVRPPTRWRIPDEPR